MKATTNVNHSRLPPDYKQPEFVDMSVATARVSAQSQSVITGCIEAVDGAEIFGWAFDANNPEVPVEVGLRVGSCSLGTGLANIHRPELQRAGYGQGAHGFRIAVNVPFHGGQRLDLELYEITSNAAIAALPFSLFCHDPRWIESADLDHRGIHGIQPLRSNVGRRKLQAVVPPVIKRIANLGRRQVAKSGSSYLPSIREGVVAKLAHVNDMTLTLPSQISGWPKIVLPEFEPGTNVAPSVSIIIPVHNQFQLTYQCLSSLVMSVDHANIEYIVVDDASTDATIALETRVESLRVIRNKRNLGFLHSCNKAASLAKGDYLVFLNNDTEVESGWIDEMLGVFDSFDDVGAVGAKLVYPDGTLQDAGGIVWASGTPWNVGHGKNRDDPEYNYVRDVDYLTGAALMVSRSGWDTVGGFSGQYAPAYYEDTDLAFKLRTAGFRTLYCPHASVVHYEGRSNGTDTSLGIKKHQVLNAEHFKNTWRQQFVGNGEEGVDLRRNKDRNRGLRILMVDNAFPRLGQDAGSYASVQELKLLIKLGCKITFLPNNLLNLGVHVDYLQRLGVECIYAPFQTSVAEFMKERAAEFDAVYITRYVVAESIIPMVREHSSARIIFNNADLHFLRELRAALNAGQRELSTVENTRRRELAVMREADAVLSYSDIEIEIISSHIFHREKLFCCPWVLNAKPDGLNRLERRGVAFMGGFGHPPNREAVDWFLRNVMPLLQARRPDISFHIWGSSIPTDTNWGSQPGVFVEGYAESLDDVFNSTVAFVAPLQSGAGIKGKVLDSLAYGVPTVLSPVAAEATGLIDGSSTLIARSPEQWLEHLENLHDNMNVWDSIRQKSMQLRDSRYSSTAGVKSMQRMLEYLELDISVGLRQSEVR